MSAISAPSSAFGELAPALVELGYEAIPIRPGTKACPLPGWQDGHPPGHYLPSYSRWGVGILCRTTPAVDLDVRSLPLVRLLVALIDDVIGGAPVRFGARPKVILPFTCDESFPKVATRWFALPDEDYRASDYWPHRLEVLASGQQFVCAGRHPDGHLYRWSRGSLLTQERIDLPNLGAADARRLVDAAETTFLAAGCVPLIRLKGLWLPWHERPDPEPPEHINTDGLNRLDVGALARRIDPQADRHGAEWRLRCPVHQGRTHTSLALEVKNDRLLWHCFAGCGQADVGHALQEYAR